MTKVFVFSVYLFLLPFELHSQNCECKNKGFDYSDLNCDTIILKDKGVIFYNYNCDSIWLSYSKNNKVFILFKTTNVDLLPYNYRLGYQLINDNFRYSIFRYGCPSNGPCNYVLFDKFKLKIKKIKRPKNISDN